LAGLDGILRVCFLRERMTGAERWVRAKFAAVDFHPLGGTEECDCPDFRQRILAIDRWRAGFYRSR